MKPLLAGKVEDINKLAYPVVASPKIDGIRCLIVDGKPVSRKLKPISNGYIYDSLLHIKTSLDGELLIPGKPFNEISSAVMSKDGEPSNFEYCVFDIWNIPDMPYARRLIELTKHIDLTLPSCVTLIECTVIDNPTELSKYEGDCLQRGYEGVMVRSPDGRYKYGRSTTNEQILLKLKRFEDSEAIIIGAIEEQHNGNAVEVDNLGRTKRSSHKANLKGKGVLGAFHVRRPDGLEFYVGTGYTVEMRQVYWKAIDMLIGKTIKYKHQPSGSKDAPRFPVFLGFRHTNDID